MKSLVWNRRHNLTQSPPHIEWFVNTGEIIHTSDGKPVEVWELNHQADEGVLSGWARRFRQNYCSDEQIDIMRRGTEHSRSEYLAQIKFPDRTTAPGPSIRAGDFSEILAADYLEFVLEHWVPSTRYRDKTVRNESEKGADTIGFLFANEGIFSPHDQLTIIESKAKFTGAHSDRLQDAIDHSGKDVLRKAESLNAIKQRFLDRERHEEVAKVERFQDEADRPYIQRYGAIAHLDKENYEADVITDATTAEHPFGALLFLVVIKGDDMMTLVHELYRRAADEA
jgi:hypothetical protein